MLNTKRVRLPAPASRWNLLPDGVVESVTGLLAQEDVSKLRQVCQEWRMSHGQLVRTVSNRKNGADDADEMCLTVCARLFPNVTALKLKGTTEPKKSGLLNGISGLASLQSLSIRSCGLTDGDVNELCSLSLLRSLSLAGSSDVSEAHVERIFSSMGNLKELDVSRCDFIDDDSLEHLCKLEHLTSLTLADCDEVSDEGLQHVACLRTLETLDLNGCFMISDDGLRHLTELSNLKTLGLKCCDKVTDVGVATVVSSGSKLSSLNLGWCSISNVALTVIASKAAGLQFLNLPWCEQLTDFGIEELTKLRNLKVLNLKGCTSLTSKVTTHLAKIQSLQILNLKLCVQMTRASVEALQKELSGCAVTNLFLNSPEDGSTATESQLDECSSDTTPDCE